MDRVIFDPEAVVLAKPWLRVVSVDAFSSPPVVGAPLVVVQAYEDDFDYVGSGFVDSVDFVRGVAFVHIDWKSFTEDKPAKGETV